MTRILTVCLGNICRSPAAEAAIRAAAADAGLEAEVDSAGTGRYHIGDPPHPRSQAAGAAAGLTVEGRARQVRLEDFEEFDVIVAMDHTNLEDLRRMAPSADGLAKVHLFRDFDPESVGEEVPDPYYGTDEDYREMIDLILPAARGLITRLQGSDS
ncbi:MAG: low molecular weight phosphotyrosine protein phosphatase [Acidimicrobiia bacterium]|nr:low molecular weight phosphotyrosine protein phosphatase [Acidimicrobiia bacterium]